MFLRFAFCLWFVPKVLDYQILWVIVLAKVDYKKLSKPPTSVKIEIIDDGGFNSGKKRQQ